MIRSTPAQEASVTSRPNSVNVLYAAYWGALEPLGHVYRVVSARSAKLLAPHIRPGWSLWRGLQRSKYLLTMFINFDWSLAIYLILQRSC